MRRGGVWFAAAFLAPFAAHAETPSLTTTLGYEARYVFRGVQLADQSFQPSASLGVGRFSVTGWLSVPIAPGDPISRRSDEIDLVVNYSALTFKRLTIETGFTYYIYPDRDRGLFDVFREDAGGRGANSLEPYVALSLDAPLAPKLQIFHDVFFDTTTIQGSAAQSFPMGAIWGGRRLSLNLAGLVGAVIDDAGGENYRYGQASADLTLQVTKKAALYVGGRYGGSTLAGGGIFRGADARKPAAAWVGAGFIYGF